MSAAHGLGHAVARCHHRLHAKRRIRYQRRAQRFLRDVRRELERLALAEREAFHPPPRFTALT